jgi:regulator of protease activity HflC (stomatin/prohibitin superfamily)
MTGAFDLGAEVFIIPSLWFVLLATVVTMLATSFRRDVVTIEDEDGDLVGEVVKWKTNKPRRNKAMGILLVGALSIAALVVVPPGHRGAIYTTSGVDVVERNEGYSLMLPILHNANMVNVREQLYETINENGEATLFAQTRDILEVPVKLGVNYIINPDKAADIFKDVGHSYEAAIIKPAVFDVATQEIGKIDAVDFPREREKLAQAILSV